MKVSSVSGLPLHSAQMNEVTFPHVNLNYSPELILGIVSIVFKSPLLLHNGVIINVMS